MPKNIHSRDAKRRSARRAAARKRARPYEIAAMVAAILAFATIVVACDSPTDKARDIHNELVYFKDHRTGLCFAYWMVDGDSRTGVMTDVPCEKVAHLLVNGAEAAR